MTVILPQFHHCDCEMCEWPNFGTLFKFPCIVRIYAWIFMHCRNHYSDSHANHVIIVPYILFVKHIEAGTKWPSLCRQHFEMKFSDEKVWVLIKILISFLFLRVHDKPALVQIMAWHQTDDKPLPEPNDGPVVWRLMVSQGHVCDMHDWMLLLNNHHDPLSFIIIRHFTN